MPAEVEAMYRCIPGARCGLCQFKLEDGEMAVAGSDAADISEQFRFEAWSRVDFLDEKHWRETPSPPEYNPTVLHYHHAECFRIARDRLSPGLLRVMAYAWEPMPREEHRRRAVMQRSMIPCLRQAFAPQQHLPDELWLKVAALLVREFAVAVALADQARGRPVPEHQGGLRSEIDLSRDVYATYVVYEGVRYVKSLHHGTSARVLQQGECRLLAASEWPAVDTAHVAFDHLGVREAQFSASGRALPGQGSIDGVWWQSLPVTQQGKLYTKSDGLKLRRVNDLNPWGHDEPAVCWSVRGPSPGPELSETTFWEDSRIVRFEYNTPGITGYSVASLGKGVCMIHAHRDRGADPEYDWFHEHIQHWIYMPIDAGEYVTELWRIVDFWWLPWGEKSSGFVLKTNRGRVRSFTSWLSETESASMGPYECVVKAPQQNGVIYFSLVGSVEYFTTVPERGIFHVPVNVAGASARRDLPQSFIPASPPMEVESTLYDRYFSSCDLDNVVEVVPCRSRPGYRYPEGIIGMIVRYANGDRACVGAFQFNWASEPCYVGLTGKLYIGCGQDPSWVKDVRVDAPPEDSDLTWMEVPLSGKLEWWFSRDKAQVHHIPG